MARRMGRIDETEAEALITQVLATTTTIGTKGAAMRIFKELGMFPKEVIFLDGSTCRTRIAKELENSRLSGDCPSAYGLP